MQHGSLNDGGNLVRELKELIIRSTNGHIQQTEAIDAKVKAWTMSSIRSVARAEGSGCKAILDLHNE